MSAARPIAVAYPSVDPAAEARLKLRAAHANYNTAKRRKAASRDDFARAILAAHEAGLSYVQIRRAIGGGSINNIRLLLDRAKGLQ